MRTIRGRTEIRINGVHWVRDTLRDMEKYLISLSVPGLSQCRLGCRPGNSWTLTACSIHIYQYISILVWLSSKSPAIRLLLLVFGNGNPNGINIQLYFLWDLRFQKCYYNYYTIQNLAPELNWMYIGLFAVSYRSNFFVDAMPPYSQFG